MRRRAHRRVAAAVVGLLVASSLALGPPAGAAPQGDRARPATPVAAASGDGLTQLTAAPAALNLAFRPDRHDYVARCPTGQTTLSGTLASGHRARLVPLGPAAGPPSSVTGAFTYAFTTPGVTSVRIEVSPAATPADPTDVYRVRCLPAAFPTFTTSVTGVPQSAYYVFTHGSWEVIVDAAGTPVWWLREPQGSPVDAKIIDGGLVTTVPGQPYLFRGWDATPTRVVDEGLDHHDLQRTADGELVGFHYYDSDRGLLEEARFVRLDADGDEVWSWRTQDHIAPEEMAPDAYKLTWGHANSVEPHGDDDVLVSIRNLDAIYDIDMSSDAVNWKLGGTPTPESLAVFEGERQLTEAEVLRLFSGQHDARVLPDGTVSVLDNGTRALARHPRVLRFSLDLAQRRATIVETVTDPRAGYSFGLASARRTSGGNWVVSWGGWNSFITELDAAGQPVFTMDGVSTYRVVPVEPGGLDDDAMRAGMDAMAGTPTGVTASVTAEGTGEPVPYAGVALLRATDLSLATAVVADAEGDVRASVPPGTYLAYVLDATGRHKSGFHGAPTPVTVTGGAPADLVAALPPTRGAVAGTVVDDATGDPIGGAFAIALDGTTGAPVAGARADGTGRYHLGGLAPGTYRLLHLDPGGAHATRFFGGGADPGSAVPVTVTAAATTTADARLPDQPTSAPTTTLQGRVTEAGTGRTLAGVAVLAFRSSDIGLAAGTVTSATGAYALDVAAGSYRLAFLDLGGAHAMTWHRDRPYHDVAGSEVVLAPATVDAALAPTTGSLLGTVTLDGGGALAGAWVVAIGPAGPAGGALTASDGTYRIDGLAPGSYRVTYLDPTGAHRQEYWADAPDYEHAAVVPVTAGAASTADAALGP